MKNLNLDLVVKRFGTQICPIYHFVIPKIRNGRLTCSNKGVRYIENVDILCFLLSDSQNTGSKGYVFPGKKLRSLLWEI